MDGKPCTPNEVLAGTQGCITPDYLEELRHGSIPDPDIYTLQVLSNFFKINPNYFFESNELKVQKLLDERNNPVSRIAQRASKLGQ